MWTMGLVPAARPVWTAGGPGALTVPSAWSGRAPGGHAALWPQEHGDARLCLYLSLPSNVSDVMGLRGEKTLIPLYFLTVRI